MKLVAIPEERFLELVEVEKSSQSRRVKELRDFVARGEVAK